jgi:hypothetical protein
MRNEFVTPFWKRANQSLSPYARRRYAFHMKAAESWELRLNSAFELWSLATTAIAKVFQGPRRSASH